MAALLLGPPAIRDVRPPPTPTPYHPFFDLFVTGPGVQGAKKAAAPKAQPPMARTENGSATYAGSGSPCLDFFFQVVPGTPAERVRGLLAAAWSRDPITALRLVANLRGVRGTGKSDREGFYDAALWVHARHPRTLACNVPALAEFGYLKDFPSCSTASSAATTRAKEKAAADKKRRRAKELRAARLAARIRYRARVRIPPPAPQPVSLVPPKPLLADFVSAMLSTKFNLGDVVPVEAMEAEEEESHDQAPMEEPKPVAVEAKKPKKKATPSMKAKKAKKAAKLAVQSLETYSGDRDYRFLFDCIAQFFADLLASDLDQLAQGGGKRAKIGLAAKWCPTPGSSFDRTTLLCEAIARRLFPRDSSPDYVLHRLRREALVPLRRTLELPKVYMSAQRRSELPYKRVASVAMRRYKALFKKHDEARFGKYLEDVEAGKAKIAAGALLPHEIAGYKGEDDEVSELQWRRMVEDLREKGSLSNCIAVCDVSGSMTGTPMEVCVALGLLISELSEQPWAGRVITFSSEPEIHTIKGDTLQRKLSFVKSMEWGFSTNFQAVFDRILRTATDARLAPEKMIRTIFVFSDMEFDQVSARPWETDYQAIRRKFRDAGYGDVVPQIVFWNLRDSLSTPVTSTQQGVAMVSSFSKNLVKLFLENDGVVNPEAMMAAAIAGEEYQKLAIFD
ncbi:LOW QUALITY PROTEIN: hypothetical protein PAHAL_3G074600 [Panicum hallii]|uniref:TROVE domain-containing protein n=1 Tax=Panicum hallii TaxID=206008 RepID=A0A2S3H722_9POAL|nr:LOW QUALITY PROTEIN: hypothetical protein PAHAL_3G074600 [Panicum hallii]